MFFLRFNTYHIRQVRLLLNEASLEDLPVLHLVRVPISLLDGDVLDAWLDLGFLLLLRLSVRT